MVNMTLALPEDLHQIMRQHTEIKWSEVARQALWTQAKKLELMEKLVGKSKFTEKHVEEIDHKIKAGLLKRFSA